ncbi:hypothetical protein [Arcobacter sp. FWKO B]|uniref:hypothetical protein n=1 Tax=Arcobacter sp. FWKO B TaxID=2593672 RepID=UPI0018A57E18|nr:hypothetical protein [Arcobacter sp. FWKO B]QOG11400.1 hypothetical protein FWKOB_01225 [Arcobacter sp. FWKO B]
MKCSKNKTLICFLIASSIAYANANENLGLITVESSTIDDKNISKINEVSSTFILTSKDIEKLNPKSVADILNTIYLD